MMTRIRCINVSLRAMGRAVAQSAGGGLGSGVATLSTAGSAYESYDEVARSYDETRRPIGLEHIGSVLEELRDAFDLNDDRAGSSSSSLKVLDAACGTGNYLKPLHAIVGDVVHGIEFSRGMLDAAEAKFSNDEVSLQQGSVLEMPYEDATFHAVTMNQALHHLTATGERESVGGVEWDALDGALAEVHRVLKPGGAFIVSTQDPKQHIDGFWWSTIVPGAARTLASRFPPVTELVERLVTVRFFVFQLYD